KRHNMGQSMAEDFTFANEQTNQEFITARLWGIADTAPYMHDGRAFTLVEAISMHGSPNSDAVTAAENFAALSDFEKNQVLSFLLSLRTPKEPVKDLLKNKD
ncbi:MAG: hypothetical protein HKO58_07535, partial [Gammaproteobacteria bacterium]|nr:hypothetical protein [Gammaproteobacteria bacterium]